MQLLQGDVLERLRALPDKTYKCIVTSPPYNLNMKYGEGINDNKPEDQYLAWMHDVFVECKRVLTDDGSIFLNIGHSNTKPWIDIDVAYELRKFLVLQNRFIWVKNITIGNESPGHFKPINSHRYVTPTDEFIFHFTKTGDIHVNRLAIGVPFADKSNLNSRSKKGEVKPDRRCRGSSWFIPYKTIQSKTKQRGDHPATFPMELPEMCIKLCMGDSKEGHVLDPFVGTGTTLLAAQKLGLQGTGIDINPEFLAFARTALHLDTPETSSN